ncbi:MAG: hypothetical protein ACOY3Z_09180 [Thermodesulfobacteriota bacterium]
MTCPSPAATDAVLANTGIATLFASAGTLTERSRKTVVVMGAPRGGTSMVAGVLATLGVEMGGTSPVFEDRHLLTLLQQDDQDGLRAHITDRNQRFACWGWKLPQAIKLIPQHIQRFEDPCLVAVFRDPFAVANRNSLSVNYPLVDNLKITLSYYALLVDHIERLKLPTLMLSYEKALQHPGAMVSALASFIGASADARREEAVRFIRVSPAEYRRNTHTKQVRGEVARAGNGYIMGWATYEKHPDLPVHLEIAIGDATLKVIANRPWPWLKRKGLHPTGACGFACKVDNPSLRTQSRQARVRVADTGEILPAKG